MVMLMLKLPFVHLKLSLHHVLAMPFGQLILGKIIKIAATRGQILKLKYTKFYFGWGSAPDPAEGANTALFQCPRPIVAGFKGAFVR